MLGKARGRGEKGGGKGGLGVHAVRSGSVEHHGWGDEGVVG